jgi:hypothetical protein
VHKVSGPFKLLGESSSSFNHGTTQAACDLPLRAAALGSRLKSAAAMRADHHLRNLSLPLAPADTRITRYIWHDRPCIYITVPRSAADSLQGACASACVLCVQCSARASNASWDWLKQTGIQWVPRSTHLPVWSDRAIL